MQKLFSSGITALTYIFLLAFVVTGVARAGIEAKERRSHNVARSQDELWPILLINARTTPATATSTASAHEVDGRRNQASEECRQGRAKSRVMAGCRNPIGGSRRQSH